MKITFETVDLVDFGNYLLSDERRELIEQSYEEKVKSGMKNPLSVQEFGSVVSHADLQNWMIKKI